MSDTLGLFLLLFVLFLIGRHQYKVRSDRKRIRAFLKKRNAENITVHLAEPFVKKGVYFYVVTYDDEAGRPHMTECKISMVDDKIYWMDEDSS